MMPRSPWIQKSSDLIYDNPWITVRHDTVVTPAGTDGIYGTIHFKNHAVGVLPIDKEGYTWLVKQTRYLFDKSSWEIPEGGCLIGKETALEAARRELKEETGLLANDWQHWLSMDLSNSVTDEQATIFVARDLIQSEAEPEDTEDIEVKRLPLAEAINMVLEGEITDAISVATLMKAMALKVS